MRRRRAERCVLRAKAALDAGSVDVARQSLDEAQELVPSSPEMCALVERLERLALAPAALPAPVASDPAPTDAARAVDEVRQLVRLSPAVSATVERRPIVPDVDRASIASDPLAAPRATGWGRGLVAAAVCLVLTLAGLTGWRTFSRASAAHPLGTRVGHDVALRADADLPPVVDLAPEAPVPSDAGAVQVQVVTEPAQTISDTPLISGTPLERSEPTATSGVETPGPPPRAAIDPVASLPAPPPSQAVEASPESTRAALETAPLSSPIVVPPPISGAEVAALTSRVEKPIEAPRPSPSVEVRAALGRFAAAYSDLDASAARAVWPTVDERALGRAFDGLTSQRVSLGQCDVRVNGDTARAACAGSAAWTPKIGGGQRSVPRRWTFELRNAAGAWRIVSVDAK